MFTLVQDSQNHNLCSTINLPDFMHIIASSLMCPNEKCYFSQEDWESCCLLSALQPLVTLSPHHTQYYYVRRIQWPNTTRPTLAAPRTGPTLLPLDLVLCSDAPHTLFSEPSATPFSHQGTPVSVSLRPACTQDIPSFYSKQSTICQNCFALLFCL